MWTKRKKPTKRSECMDGRGCRPTTPRPAPQQLYERSYIIRVQRPVKNIEAPRKKQATE